MAKSPAPAKLTGGQGFNYEDCVAGRLLLDLLCGIYSFGPDIGRITKSDWQARDTKRLLDDLVVTLDAPDGPHTAELSIKSDKQVTQSGFPANFIEAAWEEWLHVESDVFDRDADLLVLVSGQVADGVFRAWEKTLRESCQTTPDRMIARFTPPANAKSKSLSSQLQRDLFASIACPDRLKTHGPSDAAASVEILRRIRLLTFDFESVPSRDEAAALLDCQTALSSGNPAEARQLWERLVRIAAEKRGTGGSIDLPGLLAELRTDFQLNDYPDFRADWQELGRHSRDVFDDIRIDIGGSGTLDREDVVEDMAMVLRERRICLLTGESGSGKSGAAKLIAQQRYGQVIGVPAHAVASGDGEELVRALGLRHSLMEVLRTSRESILLVFDSLEKYSPEATRLVARIVSDVIGDDKCAHVSCLLISHFEPIQRVVNNLIDGGLRRELLQLHQLESPDEEAIAGLLTAVPGISYLTLHRELRSLLRNLKILDWVVKASSRGSTVSNENVTSLITLIDYLWTRWIEAGDLTIARSGLLKRIASLEADTLSSGVRLSELDHSEHESIPGLAAADLVRIREERVRFTHDLLGDWARLRVLIERDPTATAEGLARAARPRWHRAVRLFGRWLLDSPNGISRWKEAMERAGDKSKDGTVVRDLILEAVALDDAAASKFDAAWPALAENNGELLRRLLDRFLFVATLPDPRFQDSDENSRMAAHISVAFRLPFWPYWPSLLKGLHHHMAEVIRLAPAQAAQICRIWLGKTPHEFASGVPFLWRKEAAELALSVARKMQGFEAEGGYFPEDEDRIAYEAALLAAREIPEEILQLALELAQRRPPSPEISARAEAARKAVEERLERRKREKPVSAEKPSGLARPVLPSGGKRQPWPDGPTERVAESFRDAVLESGAWLSLLNAQPETAVEVLLAVCIEEPRNRYGYGGSTLVDYLGLDYWHKANPPMYFRGPFLQFFRQAPEAAIIFTIRLINFATERWAETQKLRSHHSGDPIPSDADLSVAIPRERGDTPWLGNDRVYRWHADGACDTAIITSVLMALEKYLYEQLDGGQDIGPAVQTIMDGSRSLAFAGLLVDVGKRSPDLFFNQLRPLLGVADFYFWDRGIVQERSVIHAGLIGWHRESQQLGELAREWHGYEHRKYLLVELARYLMLRSPDLATYFEQRISAWKAEFGTESVPSFIETLTAVLDRSNYKETTTEDGERALRFEPPKELAERNQQTAQIAQEDVRVLTFPTNCRQWLDGANTPEERQLDELWEILQSIANQSVNDPQAPSRKEDAILGGVAVLLCRYPEWLHRYPEKETWCLEQLEKIAENPPGRSPFDSPASVSNWHWDYFLAECGVALLSQDVSDTFARSLVADGIMAFHHGVTKLTMQRAAERGDALRELLPLMEHVAVRWSLVRLLLERSEGLLAQAREAHCTPLQEFHELPSPEEVEAIAARWREEHSLLRAQFVDGTVLPLQIAEAQEQGRVALNELKVLRPDFWGRKDAAAETKVIRRKKFYRDDFGLDVSAIQSAFSWLDSDQVRSYFSSDELLQRVRAIQELSLGTIPSPTDHIADELEGLPFDFDTWTFGLVCRTIVQIDEPAAAESLWRPVFKLGPYAHHFVEMFLWHWFMEGLQSADPAVFAQRWAAMIRFALESTHWKSESPAFYQIDGMVVELLGYHFGDSMSNDARFAPLVEEHADLLADVAERWFIMPRVLNGFARQVTKPAYQNILCHGIEWISRAVEKLEPDDFRHERDFEANVLDALRCCWTRHQNRVAAEPNLRDAFDKLLIHLVSLGSHAAMNLRDQLLNELDATA